MTGKRSFLVRASSFHTRCRNRRTSLTAARSDFEKLTKFIAKTVSQGQPIPQTCVQTLVLLEDFVKRTTENKEKVMKMSALNAKAFNAMKQKIKKHNKTFETEIAAYRKTNPKGEQFEADSEEEGDGDKAADDDGDDDEFGDDDGDDGDDEPEPEPEEKVVKQPPRGRAFWLKKTVVEEEEPEVKPEKPTRKPAKVEPKDTTEDKTTAVAEKKPAAPAAPAEDGKMTQEQVDKKLIELKRRRGLRATDKAHQVQEVSGLLEKAYTPQQTLAILIEVVNAQFDVIQEERRTPALDVWRACQRNLVKILGLLNTVELKLEEAVEEEELVSVVGAEGDTPTTGANLMGFVERLDDEYIKSLQMLDVHTQDYQLRLLDEPLLMELAEGVKAFYERKGQLRRVARVVVRIMEHLYFKSYPTELKAKKTTTDLATSTSSLATDAAATSTTVPAGAAPSPATTSTAPTTTLATSTASSVEPVSLAASSASVPASLAPVRKLEPTMPLSEASALLERLAHLVYQHGDERLKTRAVLMNIYHLSLHDRFYEARDLMLMSHLQDAIIHMDPSTQILFNRTMVQLGLCAFRKGLISEAHSSLSEMYAGGRIKELLAQGTSMRFNDKNPEQEKAEKRRLLPAHMHINLELLEGVHLVSAMLLEVPNMAANAYDVKKKVVSRIFHKLLTYSDHQVFTGPPENIRDTVVAASRALSEGNVKRCEELVFGMPFWPLVTNAEIVKAMLRRRIQEEGLRTYLFTNSRYYDSIAIDTLTELFALPKNAVHSIISKMMINEELHASWDQPSGTIVLHRVEPTRLQYLAMQLADKVGAFVENNERTLDTRTGGHGKYDAAKDGNRQRQDRGDREWQGERRGRGGYFGRRPGGYDRQQNQDGQGGSRDGGGYRDGNNYRDGGGYRGNRRDGAQGGRGGYGDRRGGDRSFRGGGGQGEGRGGQRRY